MVSKLLTISSEVLESDLSNLKDFHLISVLLFYSGRASTSFSFNCKRNFFVFSLSELFPNQMAKFQIQKKEIQSIMNTKDTVVGKPVDF